MVNGDQYTADTSAVASVVDFLIIEGPVAGRESTFSRSTIASSALACDEKRSNGPR
jgi:hypothetical protein